MKYGRGVALSAGIALLLPALSLAQRVAVQRNPIVITAKAFGTTPRAFRDMPDVPWRNRRKVMPEHDRAPRPHISQVPDAVAQTQVLPQVTTTELLNFDGITDKEGGGFVPPDTNASVGAAQVVEIVNVAYAVYDKATGNQIMAPKNIQALFSSKNGPCATAEMSDPVVNYDKAAGRWIVAIIGLNESNGVYALCTAVSETSDATGSFYLYEFNYGSNLPDYPKIAVWPDAYYLTSDTFAGGAVYNGTQSCALDRANMLTGGQAKGICFRRGTSDFAMLAADLDGATPPPAGSPNYQMDLATSTTLNLYQFHVDFTTPKNSTFTGPTKITVAAYSDACGGNNPCIQQPSGGEELDSLGDRLMYRLAYRNFGDHEALVVNHSVKATGSGNAASAVRWYEIRSPKTPVVYQSGTIGGGTSNVALWMGSIAMDQAGDIALGYSEAGPSTNPSIAYVGRVPGDPLGTMESAYTVVTGAGVQVNSSNRWGDYSSMAIDPSDDCTFWYAQEYYSTTGSMNFSTRLASFKFSTCP